MHHHAWHHSPTIRASAPLPHAALRIYLLCLFTMHPWRSVSFVLFPLILIFPLLLLASYASRVFTLPLSLAPLSWESKSLFNKYVSRAKHHARCLMESVSLSHPSGPARYLHRADVDMKASPELTGPRSQTSLDCTRDHVTICTHAWRVPGSYAWLFLFN